jgi:L-threonylcarbamoyladenylate synthase
VVTAFEACIRAGGVAVFPADTVYGLACDPEDEAAVRRIYALKGRAPGKPAALMFFDTAAAFAALPEVRGRTRALAERLLPGAVTLLVPNPSDRFPLAGGGATLGLRVPDLPLLTGAAVAVLQTSANRTGGPDARTLSDVPLEIRDAADLVIDGGALPGTPSTVVDLRDFGTAGIWRVVREGAVPAASVAAVVADL